MEYSKDIGLQCSGAVQWLHTKRSFSAFSSIDRKGLLAKKVSYFRNRHKNENRVRNSHIESEKVTPSQKVVTQSQK